MTVKTTSTITTSTPAVLDLVHQRDRIEGGYMREATRRTAMELIRRNPAMPLEVAVVLMDGNADFDDVLDVPLVQLLEGTSGATVTLREALRRAMAGEVSGETTLADLIAH